MSWTSPVPILEDEDEEALKAEFVELSRKHPNNDPFEIAKFMFRDKADPMRYQQAAYHWSNSLEIKERIRAAIVAGGEAKLKLTDKERRIEEIRAIATSTMTPHKDRVAAYKLIAEMLGEITKPIDVASKGKRVSMPTAVVLAPYAD